MEDATIFGIDLAVWNDMPVMAQIKAIEENTKNIDANTKMILEELQKEDSFDQFVDSPQFQTLLIAEPESSQSMSMQSEPMTEEPPAEEPATQEPVTEEPPAEEPTDYLKLIYEEMQTQNGIDAENQLALVEHLTVLEEQGMKSNEVDGMIGIYMMYLVPLAVVVSLGSKVLNPFLR